MSDTNTTKTSLQYSKAKTALILYQPFFASLLFDLLDVRVGTFPSVFQGGTPTAATDGRIVYFDEGFLNSLKVEEACFVLGHEVMHAMWRHIPRAKKYTEGGFDGKPFSPEVWNVATDYVINAALIEAKVGTMPKIGLISSDFTGSMGADEVYRKLIKECKPQSSPSQGQGGGQGFDLHMPAGAGESAEPEEVAEARVKQAVASAVSAAKSAGKLPANLERIARELLDHQVPWAEHLMAEITSKVGRETTTWTRLNRRRLVTQRVILPAYTGHSIGPVVVVVDTSGSIGEAELVTAMSEVEGVISTCSPERVYLLGCDARISAVHTLEGGESLTSVGPLNMGGGGGTRFSPPFDWVEQEEVAPVALIYITDMYGDFPPVAPDYPVIWCSTTKGAKAPFGTVIYIDNKSGANT